MTIELNSIVRSTITGDYGIVIGYYPYTGKPYRYDIIHTYADPFGGSSSCGRDDIEFVSSYSSLAASLYLSDELIQFYEVFRFATPEEKTEMFISRFKEST